jgi:LuxR family transcriptional regulator, quorum-sensing system regulator BjaR1
MVPHSFRHSLDHTLAFIRDLDRARNLADITAQVLRHIAPFGAEYMVASTIPKVGANQRQQLSHVLLQHWPPGWMSRYSSRGYLFHDPAVDHAKSSITPFFWNEVDPSFREDPMAQRVMGEASEFGLKEGFMAPLLTLDGQAVLFSLGGPHLEIRPDTRAMLTLIASYAIARAIALKQESDEPRPIRLSAREREALQWAAEGKADWEIGEIMNITEHGADKHLRSVRAKLGAINRTQAVAEAIRRGLIA